MIQAARNGKQDIAEGNAAGSASMKTAIKLTNVAKSSLLELLLDYEDFLRIRNYIQWEKDSVEVRFLRKKAEIRKYRINGILIWQKAVRLKLQPIW